MFANSPYLDGYPADVEGVRTRIWRGIDPVRTGYDGRHLDAADPIGAYTAFATGRSVPGWPPALTRRHPDGRHRRHRAMAALVFLLGFNVTRLRGVTAKAGGDQASMDPANRLFIAVRAHGNAIEYIPTLIVLFLLIGFREPAGWTAALMIGATAARLLHAYGMLTARALAAESVPRVTGAVGTYVFGIALAVTAFVSIW
ncbi:MAG: hypothetical protein GEV04_20715 [Actinophytocola sp.]|nr:hypothetical protein [Actinophytocola sp.]